MKWVCWGTFLCCLPPWEGVSWRGEPLSFCIIIHWVGCSVGICAVDLLAQKDVESCSSRSLYGSPSKCVQSGSSMVEEVEISQKLQRAFYVENLYCSLFPSFPFFYPEVLIRRLLSYRVCGNDISLTKCSSAQFLGSSFIFILIWSPPHGPGDWESWLVSTYHVKVAGVMLRANRSKGASMSSNYVIEHLVVLFNRCCKWKVYVIFRGD